MRNILILVTIILIAPIIIIQNQSGVPMYYDEQNDTWLEVITPYHTFQQLLLPQAYGSSAWLEEQRECTDIWQETHNESLYYACWAILDKDLE